jgi:hypothetical protein
VLATRIDFTVCPIFQVFSFSLIPIKLQTGTLEVKSGLSESVLGLSVLMLI